MNQTGLSQAEAEKILNSNAKEGVKQLQKYNLMSIVTREQLQKYIEDKNEKH